MTHYDFSPLFRSTVGFDRLSQLLDSSLTEQASSYPPYNIAKMDEDNYRITMAVAGFAEDEIEITARDNQLLIQGSKSQKEESEGQDQDITWLHRGIAERAFERRFQLADHIRVTGASIENGLLHIDLVREVPEQMKPRKIEIMSGNKLIDQKKSAKEAA